MVRLFNCSGFIVDGSLFLERKHLSRYNGLACNQQFQNQDDFSLFRPLIILRTGLAPLNARDSIFLNLES